MGLTANSTGLNALSGDFSIKRTSPEDKIIAFAGNPNVGKSSVFNALTGLHQHTGNWPGKTVATAQGYFRTKEFSYIPVDLPGTYSLLAHSREEEVARDFICFGKADAAVVVCDATCLERSLNLALQVMEICGKTLVCVNLMDEAKRRGIEIDLKLLEERLGVPVVGTSAHSKKSLRALTQKLDDLIAGRTEVKPRKLIYSEPIERAADIVSSELSAQYPQCEEFLPARWTALRLMDADSSLLSEFGKHYGGDPLNNDDIRRSVERAKLSLAESDVTSDGVKDAVVCSILKNAEDICRGAVTEKDPERVFSKADKILTSRAFGYPIMILLLMLVFWITIVGANYPSELLSTGLFWLGDRLSEFLTFIGAPEWLRGVITDGAYRVLAWVVSVMLPPMAIFFPLFTMLEDLGYLPRIAYNLDKPFCKCKACGKQALTMTMGFGCNAAGIVGCRIIDSRRERLIAMLTNVFVPCNGRFPMMLTIISLFFVVGIEGIMGSLLSAAMLTAVIVLGVLTTFLISKLLSATILKGEPSSFTLELPPLRKPQFGKIIVRSLLDRTIFVLGRAVVSAAPAGVIIWVLANVTVGDNTLLNYVTNFFDPFGRFIGMDGVIITAFLLGLPANEIVIPIIVMTYAQQGTLAEAAPAQMLELFSQNGWTWVTALCVIIFTLMHFPCATSLLTVKKEAGGWKWVVPAFVIPTVCGIALCAVIANLARVFGI